MLRKFLAVITSGWFLSLVGALLLAFIVWFLGDLIAIAGFVPLESELARLVAVIVILVAWGLHNLAKILRSRQDNDRLTAAIVDSETASSAAAAAAEMAALRQRFAEALGALKKGRRTGLYELPWYVIIGPPGAGKTTALRNSGLHFPLGHQDHMLRGAGGTRNCEWMFTNEAVLIDTAGRYTTQDSNQAVDQAAWRNFLGLLKKHRPRQPINGALVAVSAADLAAGSPAEIEAHGRAVRARLSELHAELGVRFPVYVLLTKSDLISGFIEFFDDLKREDREQVWGVTLPFAATASPDASPLAEFDRDYSELLQRLSGQLLERVEREQDGERKRRIFGFPDQMATLRQPVRAFLDTAFAHSRYDEQPLLRGVYFTSGTQEGTPIDRVMSALAANFGIERQRLAAFSGQGRSYFLTRLLHQVVFPEAALVGANWRLELRRRWLSRGALVASAAAILLGIFGWWVSYQQNSAALAEASANAAKYGAAVEAAGGTNVLAAANLSQIEKVLGALRALRLGGRAADEDVPLSMRLGLYQGDKIAANVDRKYHNALNWVLLPQLLVRIEDALRRHKDDEEFLYTTLKVYLMLGGQGKLDVELVHSWHLIDWETAFPGQAAATTRAALEEHLVELLLNFAPGHPINTALVNEVRERLLRLSTAQIAFLRLRQDPDVIDLNDWRLVDEGGAQVSRVFRRASGAAAKDVPGLFTYYGLHEVYLPLVDQYAKETAEDAWILGDRAGAGASDPVRLAREMNDLYRARFISEWQRLLDDIEIREVRSRTDVLDVMSNMTVPNSPLRQVLIAISRETAVTAPPPPASAAGAGKAGKAGKAGAKVAGKAAAKLGLGKLVKVATKATSLLGLGAATPAADPFWRQIDDRFRPLHDLALAPEGKPVPVDDLIKKLDLIRTELNALERANTPNAQQSAGKVGQMLSDLMTQYQPPVSRWIATIARSSTTFTSDELQKQVAGLWQNETLGRCRQAVNNRYPFFSTLDDISIDDFSLIFGPGGTIEKFFKDNLEAFVDRSTDPWRWRPRDGIVPGSSPETLLQFQRAAKIRETFFRAPGAPVVSFSVLPVEMVPPATQAMLEIDGKQLVFRNDAQRPTEFVWPGAASAAKGFRLVINPVQGAPKIATENGHWAFFRMLTKSRIEPDRLAERFDVTFAVDGQTAKYRFSANSVFSNLNLDALQKFRCPERL